MRRCILGLHVVDILVKVKCLFGALHTLVPEQQANSKVVACRMGWSGCGAEQ